MVLCIYFKKLSQKAASRTGSSSCWPGLPALWVIITTLTAIVMIVVLSTQDVCTDNRGHILAAHRASALSSTPDISCLRVGIMYTQAAGSTQQWSQITTELHIFYRNCFSPLTVLYKIKLSF